MNVSEKHAEWISLIEVAGPFMAVAVLEDAFPQGLDKVDTPMRQRIRAAYDEWRDAVDEEDPQLEALHREWVRLVLEGLLEYDSSLLKFGGNLPDTLQLHDTQSDVTFRPDFAVMAGEKAKLLISVLPPGTNLEGLQSQDAWLATPAERLIGLCRTSGVPVGLVTNGERWMVVSSTSDGSSSRASWYARLWFLEPVTLQAFCSLLGVRRCFGEQDKTLDALIGKSLEHQSEVTDTLGEQVRRAVEVLVQALDRADQDRNRELLKDVTPAQLFEAGLTVMMRLVVLLCAEERKLLLLGEPIYDQNYAISTLRAQLVGQASHGLEILERRQDAWSRLLATFRGVYGGITHETLRLPPLGGSLFDPDRFPFLEGRAAGTSWRDTPAIPLPIDNRTVLLLLNALQVLEHKSGAQLLSYEALDVEQIGHVYEGLLERTVKRVPEVTVGLHANSGVRKKTGFPEIYLSELEKEKNAGAEKFAEFIKETTGRSKSALEKDLAKPLTPNTANRLLLSCGNDLALCERIRPFGHLLRIDSWGDPLVYRDQSFIVTHGSTRRQTGSHYTPKSLTEPIVQHTLEPLVYVGPAEGTPREGWKLKSPAEILALKVCDMAMGSGAFLVQTCRWLADRLVEAWGLAENEGKVISIRGTVLEQAEAAEILPMDQSERVLIGRRLVADRCLYGVDINPMAVEMAKLSLWLITLQRDRPFTFLDHTLKCGDSLLGVSSVQQVENFSLRPGERQVTFATANLFRYVDEASAKRRALEDLPSNDHTQIETKNRLHAEAEAATAKVKALADCLIALELRCLDGDAYEDQRTAEAEKVQLLIKRDADASLNSQPPTINQLSAHAREQLHGRRTFHWSVEFPEVFDLGGFDAFVGNPPFMSGSRISTRLGTELYSFLHFHYPSASGQTDLCAFFFLRGFIFLRTTGTFGLVATNTISQGDTQRAGLGALITDGGIIFRAVASMNWPGNAAVVISVVHIHKGAFNGKRLLGEKVVDAISAALDESNAQSEIRPLKENAGLSHAGSHIYGPGFTMLPQEAKALIAKSLRNADVLAPFLRGEDFNSDPEQTPSRWVINFQDLPLARAEQYQDCFAIVQERVKPQRDLVKRKIYRERWWLYAERQTTLYETIEGLPRVLFHAFTSKYLCFAFTSPNYVYATPHVVVASASDTMFATVQSSFHELWIRRVGSTLKTDLRYTPTDCFQTFPRPRGDDVRLGTIGAQYHESRRQLMLTRQEGLTKTYNRFHDRGEQSADIARLRALHVEMDLAVAAAYGWTDLDLGHGFHATKQGERYTLSEPARREGLDRLLALNHQRYEEEVKAGLHDKKKSKGKTTKVNPKATSNSSQELNLDFTSSESIPRATVKPEKTTAASQATGRSSADIDQTELLNAIFNCTSRRDSTEREDLAKEVATALGFQRLREKTRELIASGLNSAIRRGLITYEGAYIIRLASTYGELEIDTLVKAINATVRPGCIYTPEEVLHNAADYLGCLRLSDTFRASLQSALTAASRRGILTKRGEEIRKAE